MWFWLQGNISKTVCLIVPKCCTLVGNYWNQTDPRLQASTSFGNVLKRILKILPLPSVLRFGGMIWWYLQLHAFTFLRNKGVSKSWYQELENVNGIHCGFSWRSDVVNKHLSYQFIVFLLCLQRRHILVGLVSMCVTTYRSLPILNQSFEWLDEPTRPLLFQYLSFSFLECWR